MSIFNRFEESAKRGMGRVQQPKSRVDNNKIIDKNKVNSTSNHDNIIDDLDMYRDDEINPLDRGLDTGFEDSFHLQPSQKSESFHFFILENQYMDLERMIRGVKDVWDKDQQQWRIKRKDIHCFTDEEAEDILRTAQSHLSPDIKLAIFHKEEYPILLNSVYEQIFIMFKAIMEYRYGRYKDQTEQYKMKQQAANIFNALMMRIKANYSRAIMGSENKATHQSVKGQESLQSNRPNDLERDF